MSKTGQINAELTKLHAVIQSQEFQGLTKLMQSKILRTLYHLGKYAEVEPDVRDAVDQLDPT